jgi:hypothetical protein
MGTSPEAFNQVKDILKRLDRSIDDARGRRLSTNVQPPSQQARPGNQPPVVRPNRAKPMAPRPQGSPGFGHTPGPSNNQSI